MKKGDLVAVMTRNTAEWCGFGLFIAVHKTGTRMSNDGGHSYETTTAEVLCDSGSICFPSWKFIVGPYEDFMTHLNDVCRPSSCKSPKNVI